MKPEAQQAGRAYAAELVALAIQEAMRSFPGDNAAQFAFLASLFVDLRAGILCSLPDLASLYPDLHRVWMTHLANRALVNELVDTLSALVDLYQDDAIDPPQGATAASHWWQHARAVLAKARGEEPKP